MNACYFSLVGSAVSSWYSSSAPLLTTGCRSQGLRVSLSIPYVSIVLSESGKRKDSKLKQGRSLQSSSLADEQKQSKHKHGTNDSCWLMHHCFCELRLFGSFQSGLDPLSRFCELHQNHFSEHTTRPPLQVTVTANKGFNN